MRQWVCINNKGYEEQLIVGKVYTGTTVWIGNFVDHHCILIKDETGIPSEYHISIFTTIDEWRDSQLKKIGI